MRLVHYLARLDSGRPYYPLQLFKDNYALTRELALKRAISKGYQK